MLRAGVIGSASVSSRLGSRIPAAVRANVGRTIRMLGLSLERRVKLQKLAGQVLNRRTGRLVRSVNTRFRETQDRFESSTGTALSYGRAWELGFVRPAVEIRARFKQALYWSGASHPVRVVRQPARKVAARPWLRPALNEMRPEVKRELTLALRGF